jgi:hypothetical protein
VPADAAARIEPTISTFSVTKGGRVAETYACFSAWDLSESLDENLARLRAENLIAAPTEKWLKEMRKILRVRFGQIEVHRPLIRLAQSGFPVDRWRSILLWHLCLREQLLSDFLETWLFPRKEEGLLRVRTEAVREYLAGLNGRGLLDAAWTPNTVDRMASGLPTYAADLGLLGGRATKEIVPIALPDEAFLYVLYWMAAEHAAPQRMISDPRWRRFLVSHRELEQELLRLHQRHRLRYESAGSVVSIELPHRSLEEYVDDLVRR